MFRFILRRALETVPVMFAVATLTFFMLKLAPGGPFDAERKVPEAIKQRLDEFYGLDKPWWQQYLIQMGRLVRGDLGFSYKYPNRTVNGVIGQAAPISLELGIYALSISMAIGLIAGVIASLKPNTAMDYVVVDGDDRSMPPNLLAGTNPHPDLRVQVELVPHAGLVDAHVEGTASIDAWTLLRGLHRAALTWRNA